MKIRTSELIGPTLDWAVAKCEEWPLVGGCSIYPYDWKNQKSWAPSTDWSQGGPIIERMFHDGLEMRQGEPEAGNQRAWARLRDGKYYWHESSPLIAAMRCHVSSKLGDEVEIPEELCESHK